MNKIEKFAVEHSLPALKFIRRYWKASILRRIKRQKLMEAIHAEIAPLLATKHLAEDFLSNGYKTFAEYRDVTESNRGYIHYYSVASLRENKEIDLSSENEPIFQTIRTIKQIQTITKTENEE